MPKSAQLIIFTEDQQIQASKKCKIVVNKITKKLIVEIVDEKDPEIFQFSFDSSFFQQEQILFILNDKTDGNNYALILFNEEKCKLIFDVLQVGKKEKFDELQKHQQKCMKLLQRLKADEGLSKNEKEKSNPRKRLLRNRRCKNKNYLNSEHVENENDVEDEATELNNVEEENLKPRPSKRKHFAAFSNNSKKQIIKAPNFKLFSYKYHGMQKRRLIVFCDAQQKLCYVYLWRKDRKVYNCRKCAVQNKHIIAKFRRNFKGEDFVMLGSNLHICEPEEYNTNEFVTHKCDATNFKVFKYTHRGIKKSTLVIFDPTNKNLCYEYFWDNRRQLYECAGCHMRKGVSAVIRKNSAGEEYVEMAKIDHICDLRQFDPDKFKDHIAIKKPLFEIFEYTSLQKKWKKLIIFTDLDKKYCYKFAYFKSYNNFGCIKCQQAGQGLFVHLLKDKNGTEYVSMKANKSHLCQPIEYVPSQFADKKTVQKPNFQIVTRKANGNFIKHLVLFDVADKSLCRELTWCAMNRCYICRPCNRFNAHVRARILINSENGEEYVELSRNEHKCELIKFKPEQWEEKFVKSPNFKVEEERNKDGTIVKKLIIFDKNDATLCHSYNYTNRRETFICLGCKNKNKYLTAKLVKPENGEAFVELNIVEHVCDPQKYNHLKVITKDDYEMKECVVDGFKRKFVIIFDPRDKSLCYHYRFYGTDKAYLCTNCKKQDAFVSARFNKTKNGEKYLSLNKTPHLCKSVKFDPEEFSARIVTAPNYKLEICNENGLEKKILAVNNSTIKTLYYSYFFSEKDGFYICQKCNNKEVNARILKNSSGEEYLALSSKSHSCKPLKKL